MKWVKICLLVSKPKPHEYTSIVSWMVLKSNSTHFVINESKIVLSYLCKDQNAKVDRGKCKGQGINEAEYSRMDHVKFVEDSL